ncbi:DUF1176 domain-containing protein [Azospirillum sp.]|uniref:DUF1176 domain-containing protein n=1 Tax=Azospirillum sp. TaxID=34012 RepID=UPI002D6BE3AE|nr:DUF1176 domain-containing protein [Azospirillum sp.]HYD70611.1 DUF1176 domain-containing protein [Azospirillum sp.]
MRLSIAASLLATLMALPFSAHAQAPGYDCARPASRADKALCDDPALASLDRMVTRAYTLARENRPGEADALRAEHWRWQAGRDGLLKDPTDVKPLFRAYDSWLRMLIVKAGPRATQAALAAARPIDPLTESGAQAEEAAAFVAYVATTQQPDPNPPPEAPDEFLSTYERYAGFTFIGALADGRMVAMVPTDCFAYQCAAAPYLLDPKAGRITRAAVDVLDKAGALKSDPHATPLGIPSVAGNQIEVFEQARGSGDCGNRWTYRADAAALRLVKRIAKPACDGKDWAPNTTVTKTYR